MRHSLIAELGLLICEWMLSKLVGLKMLTLLTWSLDLMYMYMMAISYFLTSIATWRYWIGCAFALPTLPWTNWSRTSTQRLTKLRAVAAPGRYFSLDSETHVKDFLIYFFSFGFNIRIFLGLYKTESLHFISIWRSGVSRRKAWKRRCKSTSNLVNTWEYFYFQYLRLKCHCQFSQPIV